jgi:hypothetical protein
LTTRYVYKYLLISRELGDSVLDISHLALQLVSVADASLRPLGQRHLLEHVLHLHLRFLQLTQEFVFFVLREEFQARGDSGLRFVFPPQLVFDLLEDLIFVDTIVRLIIYMSLL